MSITSETQRKYDPNKGGFAYYTLFHADKGERPSWAQDGDMLEEFGEGGKAYVCSRDAKGRIKWTEKADWDRQTGGGSGGGSGGGAEKFVVTLTQENDAWTADKSIADIVAADAANQVVVAKYPNNGIVNDIPLSAAVNMQGAQGALFCGVVTSGSSNRVVVVQSMNQGSGDAWDVLSQSIPTSSNAPLIVTMTAGQSTSNFVGDKTYKEVFDAVSAGSNVVIRVGEELAAFVMDVTTSQEGYAFEFYAQGEYANTSGSGNDYVTLVAGG